MKLKNRHAGEKKIFILFFSLQLLAIEKLENRLSLPELRTVDWPFVIDLR